MQKGAVDDIVTVQTTVQQVEWLTDTTFILRLERQELQFRAGQYVVLEMEGDSREYSICSGTDDPYIEVMVRRVHQGTFSRRLASLKPGDLINMEGPYGFFVLYPEELSNSRYYFIATGTGISPFLSYLRTYPGLDFHLLHGVRYGYEAYRRNEVPRERMVLCTSRDESGDYKARVTEFLKKKGKPDPRAVYYLCGNSEMIEEVTDYLEDCGIDPFDIRHEVFF